jgi:hypothetical protein
MQAYSPFTSPGVVPAEEGKGATFFGGNLVECQAKQAAGGFTSAVEEVAGISFLHTVCGKWATGVSAVILAAEQPCFE